MGWDKDLPIADQKLNTLAGVITDNWDAIQEADETSGTPIHQKAVLLGDRTALAAANDDPTVVGATTYLYSKQDTGAVQEAYIEDAASNIIQLTNDGKIGATNVDYEANSISFDGTITFNENNYIAAWGKIIDSSLTVSPSSGISTVTRPATGEYLVTLSANVVNNANYIVIPIAVGINEYSTVLSAFSFTSTQFKIKRLGNNGVGISGDLMFAVIGGQ
tara:strand:+ start:4731 stop:5387 length:657 start_codon:yes stop_codon:yes gene_type:complete